MEFFEKAHVAKSTNSSRKDSKSEEAVKKQLKQMLYGYHHGDNDIIKNSGDVKKDLEDSSSVSGFSDLNLTHSSVEGDMSQELVSSDDNDVNKSDNGDLTSDKSENLAEENTSQSLSFESISEYDENMQSLSRNLSLDAIEELVTEESENNSDNSFIETSTDLDSDSDDESDFDPDGTLAARIFDKLNKTKNKKPKKRKFEEINEVEIANVSLETNEYKGPYRPKEVDDTDDDDVKMDDLSIDMSNIRLPENKQFAGPYRPKDLSFEEELLECNSQNESINSLDFSSPFISVVATDMPSQNLDDIIGDYQHPTMRNLPSESQNVHSFNTSGFETENVSVVDIQTEDDVGSLIPEIDNDLAVEELDLELTELDTSVQPLEDSPTSVDAEHYRESSERELSTDSIDPMLVAPVKIYYGKNNNCVLVLKHPTQIYIHGKVKVKVLGGTVEVLGCTLQDGSYEVFAPNYNCTQYLKTVVNQNPYHGLFSKLTLSGLSVAEAEDIVTSINEYDGIVLMQPLKSRQIDFVESNFTVTDLFTKLSKSIDNIFKNASELLGCSLYLSKPWKCFEENVIWKQAVNCGLNRQSKGIVCGGKGVGKSTFLRYYVNKLLARSPVLVIDLDPGQCEFTVAGNVSATVVTEPLLGPNFTHLKTPEIMLNIGMINTMDNPRRYAAAVQTIIGHCSNDSHLRELPWAVNTMGMTNTIGLKLMTLIILHTKPTFLIQIDSKNTKKRYDFHLYPQTVKNLYFEDYQHEFLFRTVRDVNLDYEFFLSHHADSSVKQNLSLAPRDERYLNFLAYFGQLLNMKTEDLLGIVPYEVNLKDLSIGLNVKVNEDAVTKVINGKVVALCQRPPGKKREVFTLPHTPLRCFGTGLIRGVDWEKGVLYIITPAAPAALEGADCLLYADWVPELRGPGTVAGLPMGTSVPHRTAAHYDQRRFMFTPKRRFNPLQLLKMSRSS